MPQASEKIMEFFWKFPEYWNAWKLAFEDSASRRPLIMRILRTLPDNWGSVKFLKDFGDDRFILLFTHDIDNDGAKKNEFQTILPLIETAAFRFIGAEGTTGRIDLDRFYQFPSQDTIRIVAEYLFREGKISPLIAAAFYSTRKAEIWGIEDPNMYERARVSLLEGKADYWSLIDQRVPIIFENLLLLMEERSEQVAGVTITEYNFLKGHSFLSERRISHAGIQALSEGKTDFGRTIRQMKAPPSPLEKLFEDVGQKEKEKISQQYQEWKNKKKLGDKDYM